MDVGFLLFVLFSVGGGLVMGLIPHPEIPLTLKF
jgi:hypothetical protein